MASYEGYRRDYSVGPGKSLLVSEPRIKKVLGSKLVLIHAEHRCSLIGVVENDHGTEISLKL